MHAGDELNRHKRVHMLSTMKKSVIDELENHRKPNHEYLENVHKGSQTETSKDGTNIYPKHEYNKNNNDQQESKDPWNKSETGECTESIYETIDDYLE